MNRARAPGEGEAPLPPRTLAMPTIGASAEGGGAAASQPKGHHFHNYFGENLSDGGGGSHRPRRQQPLSDVNADLGSALHSNVIRTRRCPVTSTSIAPTPWKLPWKLTPHTAAPLPNTLRDENFTLTTTHEVFN